MKIFSLLKSLIRLFLDIEDESESILFRSPKQPIFSYLRAHSIMRRIRVLAFVFMILVPGWIVIDALVFPQNVAGELAVARIGSSVLFCALAIYTLSVSHKATWVHAYLSLVALILIPTFFGIYVDTQIGDWMLSVKSMTAFQDIAFQLYLQLPIIMVAGIALFPLAIMESIPLILTMAGLTVYAGIKGSTHGNVPAESIADAWAILIGGGAIALSTLIQLQYTWHVFRVRALDPETKLLTRDSALKLLKLSWQGRGSTLAGVSVSMMKVPTDTFKTQPQLIKRMLEPGLDGVFGVRWSQDCIGFVKMSPAGPRLTAIQERVFGKQSDRAQSPVIADASSEQFRSPLELIMVAEERLKKRLGSSAGMVGQPLAALAAGVPAAV